jgi:hypothetical protein
MLCNHRQHSVISTVQLRDMNELEGTLLDPDALTGNTDALIINHSGGSFSEESVRNQHLHQQNFQHNINSARDEVSGGAQNEVSSEDPSTYHLNKGIRLKPRTTRNISAGSNDAGTHADSNLIHSPLTLQSAEVAATPSCYFQYTDEVIDGDRQMTSGHDDIEHAQITPIDSPNQPKQEKYIFTPQNDNEIMIGDTPSAHAISTALKAKLGSDLGRLNAVKEKEKIQAANREAKAKPFHDKTRIEAAKKIARQRSREGFGFGYVKSWLGGKSASKVTGSSSTIVSGEGDYHTTPLSLLASSKRKTSLYDDDQLPDYQISTTRNFR